MGEWGVRIEGRARHEGRRVEVKGRAAQRFHLVLPDPDVLQHRVARRLQGYLAHKKHPPPRRLQGYLAHKKRVVQGRDSQILDSP